MKERIKLEVTVELQYEGGKNSRAKKYIQTMAKKYILGVSGGGFDGRFKPVKIRHIKEQ